MLDRFPDVRLDHLNKQYYRGLLRRWLAKNPLPWRSWADATEDGPGPITRAWNVAVSFETNNVDTIAPPVGYTARSAQGGASFIRTSTRAIAPAGAIAPTSTRRWRQSCSRRWPGNPGIATNRSRSSPPSWMAG